MVGLHNGLRWIVLVAAVVTLVAAVMHRRRGEWPQLAQSALLVYVITVTVQLVLGLVLWVTQQRWDGDEFFRSFIHPPAMIIATGIAHAGLARVRRAEGAKRATTALITVGVSLVIIVLAIPRDAWPT
jgi:drug/metabolite transporter (DMT)-like permease